MSDAELLDELLLTWEEHFDRGRDVPAAELCQDCPHLVERLAKEVTKLKRMRPPRETPPDLPELPRAEFAGLRYQPQEFLARGGLGEVFVALDAEVGREVALKRIQPQKAREVASRERFLREAEITGRLEHPGIVPLYGRGVDAAGQPFYAMRFIRGQSLREAIAGFHQAEKPGRDPGERNTAFRRLLHQLIAVCNTVAYSHSRGVIHRDLKPQNIMLGKYGETQLVDWGLARGVGRDVPHRDPAEDTLQPATQSSSGSTLMGVAAGTPGYMSPEQATGQWDLVGPASDIFSLGATFYAILTGQPPYQGERALQDAKAWKFAPPRQVRPETPRALEAICLKAMARTPEERYATALELAADLEHWLADEPVSAYREPLPVRARRWARKHKPLMAAVSALVLTTLLLGGGLGLWWKQQYDALVGAVRDHLDKAENLRNAEQWDQARQALDRAEARLAGAGPAGLQERLQTLREQLEVVRQLDSARMYRLVIVKGKLDYAYADRAYQKVFANRGLDPLGLDAASLAERVARTPIRKQLVVALDDWALVKYLLNSPDEDRLLAVARLVDEDPWRQQLRDPSVREDSVKLQLLAEAKEVLMQSPANLILLSFLLEQAQSAGTAEELLRQAQQCHPSDFWINFELAALLGRQQSSNKEEAIGYYRAALALQPRSGAVYSNLAFLLAEEGRLAEAEATYRKAVEHQPDYTWAWYNFGVLLEEQQKPAEAEEAYRKAVEHQPDFVVAWNNLGKLLRDQRKLAGAEDAFRKAVEHQPDFVVAWNNLGGALAEQRKFSEAEAAYRKALEHQPDFAPAWNNLGVLLKEQGKLAEAEDAFRKAVKHQPDLAPAWYALGNLLRDQGRPADAEAAFRKALEIQPDEANAHCGLGLVLLDQGHSAEALASLKKGHDIGSRDPEWPVLSGLLVRRAERLVELDAKLPAILKGEMKADAAEQIELAWLCLTPAKKLYATAARFYGNAFASDLKLANAVLYNAARAAALAGCGQGKDADQTDEDERFRFRDYALAWLQADLAAWSARLQADPDKIAAEVRQVMQYWQHDADLAGVRDATALTKLPQAEQQQWQKLWADVADLLKRAEDSGSKAPQRTPPPPPAGKP